MTFWIFSILAMFALGSLCLGGVCKSRKDAMIKYLVYSYLQDLFSFSKSSPGSAHHCFYLKGLGFLVYFFIYFWFDPILLIIIHRISDGAVQ